jgi:LPS-assembly protein
MNFSKQLFAVTFILFFALIVLPRSAGAQVLIGYDEPEYSPQAMRLTGERGALEQRAEQTRSTYMEPDTQAPVDLTADSLTHDESSGVITAIGGVELVQSGRVLRADRVSYNVNTDTVIAKGNVVLHEPNGDVHIVDEVELTNNMKDGFVKSLRSYLSDGGMFRAAHGERINDSKIVMSDASYTPCDCETDGDGDPAWALHAKEITYDENTHNVEYSNARFELFGTPVLWTPYFIHSDGKVKRKSGFLTPGVGYDSELGLVVTPRYYWDIAANKDATFGLMLSSTEVPVFLTQYRQRFERAHLEINGSVGYSDRTDSEAGEDVSKEDELRGHIFAEAGWDINNKWRSGLNLELSSDDQYLRQFDISSDDILENEIYFERLSGRNYSVIRALAFQDMRIRSEAEDLDQPNILPELIASFYGEPNALLGGRWNFEASILGLSRDNNQQDMARLSSTLSWQNRIVTKPGFVLTTDLSGRADFYKVNDREIATRGSGRSNTGSEARAFAQSHTVLSYPLVKQMERAQAVVEPVAALTIAPNVKAAASDIPNEDSQDVQIDTSNLFNESRFPGLDRIEDKSRVTYGVRSGVYGHEGSHFEVFAGQSRRFDEDDNPFMNGSGLDDQDSDIVGQVSGIYRSDYSLNYRFQLDNHNLSSQRHELDAYGRMGRIQLSNRYLFAKAIEGTSIEESREQLNTALSYKVNNSWRLSGTSVYDLGDEPGLRKATLGADYMGCCINFSIKAERNLTSDASGDSSTDVTFRIGLKNIGEFSSGGDSFSMYGGGN